MAPQGPLLPSPTAVPDPDGTVRQGVEGLVGPVSGEPVATPEEVERTMRDLVSRLEQLDDGQRALLPSRRSIEAHCPDLDLTWHATLEGGRVTTFAAGPSPRRWQIRVSVRSDDLLAMYEQRLDVRQAYLSDRLQIRASMTDLLRLRAAL